MIRFPLALWLLLLLGISAARANEPKPPADLVVLNGKVWTVDPAKPRAEAIAVVGDRIVAVGTNEEIKKWLGPLGILPFRVSGSLTREELLRGIGGLTPRRF